MRWFLLLFGGIGVVPGTTAAVMLVGLGAWGASAQTVTPPPAQPTQPAKGESSEKWSWFSEAGASPGNNLSGGLGIAMDAGANQQVFGELEFQTGKVPLGQASNLLIGVKSNYPQITVKGRKLTPFSLVAFGASIDTLKTVKAVPSSLDLSASTITEFGTSAGFAEQYGAGFQTGIGAWNVGLGFSTSRIQAGWREYPFVFVSRTFN